MATGKFPEISLPPPRNNPLFLQICSLMCFSWYLYQVAKTTTPCPGGGIGRRAGFRCQCSIRTCGFKSRPGHHVKSRDIVPVGVSRFSAFGCPRLPKTRHSQRREYCEGQATVRAKIVPRLRVFNTITGTWFWLQLSLVVSDTHLELLLKALEVPALGLARTYSQNPPLRSRKPQRIDVSRHRFSSCLGSFSFRVFNRIDVVRHLSW